MTTYDEIFIDGDQDTTQLRVQGFDTQTNPLQTWETNIGDLLMRVTGDGRLEVGDLDMGTPDALLEANNDITLPSSVPQRGIQSRGLIHGAVSNAIAWIVSELELLGTEGVSGLHTALRSKITQRNSGVSTAAELSAAECEVVNETGSGQYPVKRAVGLRSAVTNGPDAYLNEAVGVNIVIHDDGGSQIQKTYGLSIDDLPAGSVETHAIHTGKGSVHIGDDLEVKVFAIPPDGNPPGGFVKVYPKLDGGIPRLYAKDASAAEHLLGGGEGSTPIAGLCHGRLTLSSGTPIPVADVLAAGTLYFTPFKGNQVALFDGTKWSLFPFTERSLSLSGLAANTLYDIFLYDNSGALTLETVAWTNDTTRATALVKQDGIYVKTGDATRRYLGTIRTTAAGQTEDSVTKRYVYNENNQVPRKLKVVEPEYDWTYSTAAWRAANNNVANRVGVVIGNVGPLVSLDLMVRMYGAGAGGAQGMAYDAMNTNHADVFPNVSLNALAASHLRHYPAIGYHYYQWVENGRGQAQTMYGYAANSFQSGMVGEVML